MGGRRLRKKTTRSSKVAEGSSEPLEDSGSLPKSTENGVESKAKKSQASERNSNDTAPVRAKRSNRGNSSSAESMETSDSEDGKIDNRGDCLVDTPERPKKRTTRKHNTDDTGGLVDTPESTKKSPRGEEEDVSDKVTAVEATNEKEGKVAELVDGEAEMDEAKGDDAAEDELQEKTKAVAERNVDAVKKKKNKKDKGDIEAGDATTKKHKKCGKGIKSTKKGASAKDEDDTSKKSRDQEILSTMMKRLLERNSSSMSFAAVTKCIFGQVEGRPLKKWKAVWQELVDDECIEASDRKKGENVFEMKYELTEKGVNLIASDKYKQCAKLMDTPAKSTAELHDRIRKCCELQNKWGAKIFDKLLQYGGGWLHKKELAALVGTQAKGPNFFYPLQKLVQDGYVEQNKQMVRLSDKSFVKPGEDRPEPVEVDESELETAWKKVYKETPMPKKANEAKSKDDLEGSTKKTKMKKRTKPETTEEGPTRAKRAKTGKQKRSKKGTAADDETNNGQSVGEKAHKPNDCEEGVAPVAAIAKSKGENINADQTTPDDEGRDDENQAERTSAATKETFEKDDTTQEHEAESAEAGDSKPEDE